MSTGFVITENIKSESDANGELPAVLGDASAILGPCEVHLHGSKCDE